MSISERIEMICDFEGSQTKFSEKTGIVQQTVSRIISKKSSIRSDNLLAIAKAYPTLDIRWLVTGEGEMWLSKEDADQTGNIPSNDDQEGLKDEIIALQKARIKMLEEQIRLKDAEWGKGLGVE